MSRTHENRKMEKEHKAENDTLKILHHFIWTKGKFGIFLCF